MMWRPSLSVIVDNPKGSGKISPIFRQYARAAGSTSSCPECECCRRDTFNVRAFTQCELCHSAVTVSLAV
jgi:hypothetical protein